MPERQIRGTDGLGQACDSAILGDLLRKQKPGPGLRFCDLNHGQRQ
jgi:hypothetical protein